MQGNTALHFAVEARSLAVARLLVDHGANLMVVNEAGMTPYALAEKDLCASEPGSVIQDIKNLLQLPLSSKL